MIRWPWPSWQEPCTGLGFVCLAAGPVIIIHGCCSTLLVKVKAPVSPSTMALPYMGKSWPFDLQPEALPVDLRHLPARACHCPCASFAKLILATEGYLIVMVHGVDPGPPWM